MQDIISTYVYYIYSAYSEEALLMSPKTSFAMVQTGVRELTGQDIPIPQIDDDSAILQIEACGICGQSTTGNTIKD